MVIGNTGRTEANQEWRIDSTGPEYIWVRVRPHEYGLLERARLHYGKAERGRLTLSDTIASLTRAAARTERGLAGAVYRPSSDAAKILGSEVPSQ